MIVLLLGSNLGDREACLNAACGMLEDALKVALRRTEVMETEAMGFEGPAFLNMAVAFDAPEGLTPIRLLNLCQRVEVALGRPRHNAVYDKDGRRVYASRTIDIDILKYDDVVRSTKRLTLPHPQIYSRPFAAALLKEIESN
ncbi:MAG: 2-amino-4-hydroxy-6-hydroxymethyldihydropteridine diphosphokinase [Bacteroidales bacterium]|nr:2-amino-4-hydroxy-6-hydroxymethyldihydropteridine diphosphokinase [Bacteroidales bacterium]